MVLYQGGELIFGGEISGSLLRRLSRRFLITNAELLDLFNTPIGIVRAPGPGFVNIMTGLLVIKPEGTPFDILGPNQDLTVRYTDAAGLILTQVEGQGFLDAAPLAIRAASDYAAAKDVNSYIPVPNVPLVIHMESSNVVGGDTGLICEVGYEIHGIVP